MASTELKAVTMFRGISCRGYCSERVPLSAADLLLRYVVNYIVCVS